MPSLDPILFWNDVALEANRVSHTNGAGEQTGPPLSARALAIVHLAMYDAYAGVVKDPANLPSYLPGLPAPAAGSSPDAAVAAAAYTTLSRLFPSQQAFFNLELSGAGNALDPGHAYGVTVGQAILEDRKNDPDAGAVGYVVSQARGRHRPDPDAHPPTFRPSGPGPHPLRSPQAARAGRSARLGGPARSPPGPRA